MLILPLWLELLVLPRGLPPAIVWPRRSRPEWVQLRVAHPHSGWSETVSR